MNLLNGIKWLGLSRIINKGILILFYVYLGANLDKNTYGIIAILVMIASYPNWFTFGFEAVLIKQKIEPTKEQFDVTWTYDRFLLRVVLSILLFVFSEPISLFFNVVEHEFEIKLLCLVAILQALENNVVPILMRELNFKKRFFLDTTNPLFILFFFPFLVFSENLVLIPSIFICSSFLKLILAYRFSNRKPSFNLNFNVFKGMFKYGKWISVSSLMTNLKERFDVIALAYLFQPTTVAIYHANNLFTNKIISEIYLLGNKVLFPVQSREHHEPYKVIEKFQIILYIVSPLLLFISFHVLRYVISALYDLDYLLEQYYFVLLLISAQFRLLTGINFTYFRVVDKPNFEAYININYLLLNLVTLFLVSYFYEFSINVFIGCLLFVEYLTYLYTLFLKSMIEPVSRLHMYMFLFFQFEMMLICYFLF